MEEAKVELVRDAAKRVGLSAKGFRHYIRTGRVRQELRADPVGRQYAVVFTEDVDALLREREEQAALPAEERKPGRPPKVPGKRVEAASN
jgi:topoisomerase IA-like protein